MAACSAAGGANYAAPMPGYPRSVTKEQREICAGILACLNCGDGGGLDGLENAARRALDGGDWRILADYLCRIPRLLDSGVE